MEPTLETTLYPPVKRFLEGLGFEAKGEIRGCDIVALDRGDLFVCPIALGRLVGESQAVGKQHRVLSHIREAGVIGVGLPDDAIHAPNEKFHLKNFELGIVSLIRFLEEVGR